MDGVSILNSSQVNGTGINNPLDSSLIENGRDSLICCVLIIDTIDDVKLEDGVVTYWSKKTKKYVPVKEKNKDSIFFEIKTALGVEFVTESELF